MWRCTIGKIRNDLSGDKEGKSLLWTTGEARPKVEGDV